MTKRIIFAIIGTVIGISAIIILLCAINTNRKSEQEIKEIDAFIESMEGESDDSTGVSIDLPTVADSRYSGSSKLNDDISSDSESTEEETTLTVEELAWEVINAGITGDERKAYLRDRYDEVQKWIDENYIPPVRSYSADAEPEPEVVYDYPTGDVLTPSAGVVYFNGHMETYYNLDMSGVLDIMYSLGYSGDYWIRSDGCKMFGDYIMVACDFGWMPRGSVVLTSLGWGMVCDTGAGGSAWVDVATTW